MLELAMAAILAAGGSPMIDHGDSCDPLPAIAAQSLTIGTPGVTAVDPQHAVLSVTVPLLTPPIRVVVGGAGLRWESGVLEPAPAAGSLRAVSGDEERRGTALPPLRLGAHYDVSVAYAEPTPEGCLPPRPSLIGSFSTP
ncbi:hypothetical protein EPN44_08360 [bacterium]|nr:MAG: hypothetical protein EPN44_08360 [bacterium]